ncbi:hypothetical protein E2P81_ATG06040 [Venturia nashicola]|nr:hypothetical protein E2P81_ATG06040 [Venturia nashicola]
MSSTMIVCCPSAYDLKCYKPGSTVGSCGSPLTSGQTITFLVSSSQGIVTTSLAINSSTFINAVIIQGWNVVTATPSSSTSSTLVFKHKQFISSF